MSEVLLKLMFMYVAVINIAAFIVSGTDKHLAKKKARRVPEKTLILLSAIGGGIGMLASFYLFRHKTRHYGLLAVIWIITLAETALFIRLVFFG